MDAATIEAYRREQRALYGHSVADLVDHLTAALGLSQTRLADTLGIPGPVLVQLISAQRATLPSSRVLARLHALTELAESADDLSPAAIAARLAEIAPREKPAPMPSNEDVERALRDMASPEALVEAADAVVASAPVLSRLLRHAAQSAIS